MTEGVNSDEGAVGDCVVVGGARVVGAVESPSRRMSCTVVASMSSTKEVVISLEDPVVVDGSSVVKSQGISSPKMTLLTKNMVPKLYTNTSFSIMSAPSTVPFVPEKINKNLN